MNKTILIAISTVISLTSTLANSASHNKLVFLDQYDSDKNGDLLLAEFDDSRQKTFDKTDENNDGVVDENEYVFEYQNRMDKQLDKDRAGQIKQTVVRFKAVDKDDDDKMTWQEYQASGIRSFTNFDVNKDGVIDDQDPKPKRDWQNKAKKEKTAEELAEEKQNKILRAKQLLRMPSTHNREGMFAKYDTNKNKRITKAEFDKRRRQDFNRTDEDNNGWVSEDEYIFEYENRLDKEIARTRTAAIKQTHVRFEVLDKNKNGEMTLEEYQLSGHRSFNRWDTNKDGIVNNADPAPTKREPKNKNMTAKTSNY